MKKIFTKKRVFLLTGFIILILISVYAFMSKTPQPAVLDTDPVNGTSEVLETSQVNINFDSTIQEKAKAGISIASDPSFDFDSAWLVNTYKIIPKSPLQNSKTYAIRVLFNGKEIYSFSFDTATFSQADIKKYGSLQSQNDYVFGQATKKVVEQYPFYTSLPIKTKDYVIYYDFQQQKFAVTFLVNRTSDEQKALIQEALIKLKGIGAKDPILYYINIPQP